MTNGPAFENLVPRALKSYVNSMMPKEKHVVIFQAMDSIYYQSVRGLTITT